ncbi:hypothetical protein AX774_g944 [Zancudomyces culisetae]|uniref:Uncharacterized protein n=1 Tax=Zancudomyces culisetae TaxID=1213189 RepID=A0A1R1PX68_ZANCU|nr:hypothetical protein AX774_g944 [Zancudomyces culisetae]|eukprot:OMH85512.1 hypothetical protein AX774_g944 [Zancudomyces culisetae]
MELAKIRNDMAEYNTRKEAYVNITAYIDKKLSKVRLFANSNYFDVVDIDVSGGTPKLYLSNNNVYHSRYEWAMDYSTDESTAITNELIGLLNMEFEFLTDHGIIAEIKASLAE